ncbi:MAG: DUF3134 domain-containing protein, partial [Microcoleaceae cyanobacterium]
AVNTNQQPAVNTNQQPAVNTNQQPAVNTNQQTVMSSATAEVESNPVISTTIVEVKQPVEQTLKVERRRNSQPQTQSLLVYNPSLRFIPRHEPADVIPSQQNLSLLNWLETSGRMLPRDPSEAEIKYLEEEEEISELIAGDDNFHDDEDEDPNANSD